MNKNKSANLICICLKTGTRDDHWPWWEHGIAGSILWSTGQKCQSWKFGLPGLGSSHEWNCSNSSWGRNQCLNNILKAKHDSNSKLEPTKNYEIQFCGFLRPFPPFCYLAMPLFVRLASISSFVELVWGLDMALGRSDWCYDEISVAGGLGFRLTERLFLGILGCINFY